MGNFFSKFGGLNLGQSGLQAPVTANPKIRKVNRVGKQISAYTVFSLEPSLEAGPILDAESLAGLPLDDADFSVPLGTSSKVAGETSLGGLLQACWVLATPCGVVEAHPDGDARASGRRS